MTETKQEDDLTVHHEPYGISDRFAYRLVKFLRVIADAFFAKRYGHRAIVLETVAAVPGMAGGAILHLRSLRRMEEDHGWIHTLLEEAENERMHLMTFIELEKPTWLERAVVILVQGLFCISYSLLYIISSKTAHRVVGYLEEEAVISYTEFLECIDNGEIENVPAPDIAIEYWDLPKDARLRDVVVVVRADEMQHREVNHCMANKITGTDCDMHVPANSSSEVKEKLQECSKRDIP